LFDSNNKNNYNQKFKFKFERIDLGNGTQDLIMNCDIIIEESIFGGQPLTGEPTAPFNLIDFFAAFIGGIGFDIIGAFLQFATQIGITCKPQMNMDQFTSAVTVHEGSLPDGKLLE